MKFGVRECANIVFKAKSDVNIGTKTFKKGQPVLYIDTAKTSTMEGAATTVSASGGRGNTRLIGWEGEKTLTFTVEDALLSPMGFAILSGAGLFGTGKHSETDKIHFHTTTYTTVSEVTGDGDTKSLVVDLTDAIAVGEAVCDTTGLTFVALTEEDGSIKTVIDTSAIAVKDNKITITDTTVKAGDSVFVDYYILKDEADVEELQIDAEHFAGYYYVEADTLFRRQSDGVDLPANLTFPNVKIQSNFTFTMASTGDPSTFTFTMDAYPGYTLFDKTKKVLCVMQIANDEIGASEATGHTIMDTHDHSSTTVKAESESD
jgi:hypothetical protein